MKTIMDSHMSSFSRLDLCVVPLDDTKNYNFPLSTRNIQWRRWGAADRISSSIAHHIYTQMTCLPASSKIGVAGFPFLSLLHPATTPVVLGAIVYMPDLTRVISLPIALGCALEPTGVHVAGVQTSRPAEAQRSSLCKMRKWRNGNSLHQRCVQLCLSLRWGLLLKRSWWYNFSSYCAEIGHFSWAFSKLSGQQEALQQYILMRPFHRASHSVSQL